MSEVLDHQEYSQFVASHGDNIRFFAKKYGLEISEVQNDLYVLWASQIDYYSPSHKSGASIATYLFAALERQLQTQLQDPSHTATVYIEDHTVDMDSDEVGTSIQRGTPHSSRTTKRGADASDDRMTMAIGGVSYFAKSSIEGFNSGATSPEEQLEDLITRSCADIAFEDVIKGHAVYAFPRYRKVIDCILAGRSNDQIVVETGFNDSYVRRSIREIVDHLQRKDVIYDSKLLKVKGDQTIDADPVRYRAVDSLVIVKEVTQVDRQQAINLAISYIDFEMNDIVVIDQFNRVLNGAECVVAATLLGIGAVKTVMNPVTEGVHSRTTEAFARKRAALLGVAERSRDLIEAFQVALDEGGISELVAARLSHLPIKAQHLVRTILGRWLLRMVGLAEANKLVSSHAEGNLEEILNKLKQSLVQKVEKLG